MTALFDTAWALLVAPFADFGFMQNALLGCMLLSVSAAPVGVFLVLRRMSLTGDAMAHGILPEQRDDQRVAEHPGFETLEEEGRCRIR